MIAIMNLIITWLISVVLSAGIGFFYAKQKYNGQKKKTATEKAKPTAEEIYEREKRAQEERNFWNYDGTAQNDSTAL